MGHSEGSACLTELTGLGDDHSSCIGSRRSWPERTRSPVPACAGRLAGFPAVVARQHAHRREVAFAAMVVGCRMLCQR